MPPTKKGKGKTTKIMKPAEEASPVEDMSSAEEMQDNTGDNHKKGKYSHMDYPLPPSPLKNNNADLSPGIQCCIPPMRKQKAKATAGMKPLEEGYDSTPHNQKCCKVDSVNDSDTIHMFKFITVLHLALPVTENLQASTSARPNT